MVSTYEQAICSVEITLTIKVHKILPTNELLVLYNLSAYSYDECNNIFKMKHQKNLVLGKLN